MERTCNYDDRIRKALMGKASTIHATDQILETVLSRLDNPREKHTQLHLFTSMKKRVAAAMICVFVTAALLVSISPETRAMAAKAIDSIRSVFQVEMVDGEYKVVEKSAEDKAWIVGRSKITQLQDEEISNLIGISVNHPGKLYDYDLVFKSIGVTLYELFDYKTSFSVHWSKELYAAIEDDSMLKAMERYRPCRQVFACYGNKETGESSLFIRSQKFMQPPRPETIVSRPDVGSSKGYWLELHGPEYHRTDNGAADVTKRPEKIRTIHVLTWVENGIDYMLGSTYEHSLTLQESVKIAESFMKAQN